MSSLVLSVFSAFLGGEQLASACSLTPVRRI
jgi:hypothetical protein